MGSSYEGTPEGASRRVVLVIAKFNEFVTRRLRDGALRALVEHGVATEDIDEVWVPGAFEIPLAATAAAESGRYAAVICLGAVIRGETPHFDYVAGECARGVRDVSRTTGIPAIFGVLTTDTPEQALARAGGEAGDKGRDSALAALEMASLLASLRGS